MAEVQTTETAIGPIVGIGAPAVATIDADGEYVCEGCGVSAAECLKCPGRDDWPDEPEQYSGRPIYRGPY